MDPRDENRIAKIRIDRLELQHLLGLPEGMRIERVVVTQDPVGFNILVSGSHLEPQPYDTEAPMLPGTFERRTLRYGDRIYTTWDWHPTPIDGRF